MTDLPANKFSITMMTLDVVVSLEDDLDGAACVGTGCRCRLQSNNGHDEWSRILYFLCFQSVVSVIL